MPNHHAPTGHAPASPAAESPAPACTMVLFGAGGDLAKRLLVPALYNLAHDGLLDDGFRLLGIERPGLAEETWKDNLHAQLEDFVADKGSEAHFDRIDETAWSWLMKRASLQSGDVTKAECYADLGTTLGQGSAFFYLALPASLFQTVGEGLGKAGLLDEPADAFRRLVIEKPFGADLDTARELDKRLLGLAREEQILRIDHFMGKEPVQSILALRFANRVIEPLLNATHVEYVEITAAETLGVEGRANFYEQTGALRDMVPNHLVQLLCMAAMDAPSSMDSEAIRDEKTRLLRAARPVLPEAAAFGQYDAGEIGGDRLPGYRDEPGVDPASRTETYCALRVDIDNWRWSGTPFLLRTGKRLAARRTEIVFRFRPAPIALWRGAPGEGGETADRLVLSIAPQAGVTLSLDVKRPGPRLSVAPVDLEMSYDESFGEEANVGYEGLLYDAMTGTRALFQRADTVEAAWAMVDPLLHGDRPVAEPYRAGSQGPKSADHLHPKGAWRHLGGGRTG